MYKTIKSMREALEEARAYRDTTEGGPGSGPQGGGKKFSSSQIKKAYGILNDPRYKQGNYSGAVKTINKLAPGLADQPDVKNALKRANEELEEASKYLRYSDLLIQLGRMKQAGDKQGEMQTQREIDKEKKKLGITDEFIPEGMMKRLIGAVQDKLSKEGGAAGFADLAKAAKSMGVTLTKDMLKDMPGVKQHRDGDYILEETELQEAFTKADFAKLEADNQHGEAAEKLVQKFGTREERNIIAVINIRHHKTGYISGPDFRERTRIVNKYYSRLK